jgi:NADPH2:quinone reductase
VEEVPDPVPGKGEVLVRLRCAGVNPVEAYLRAGTHYREVRFPWTPGTDGAGEVEGVGPGVSSCAPGDRVYTSGSLTGTYAERCLCREDQVHPLPASLSFARGAGVHVPCATAWWALHRKAGIREGETLLVHGASGGVGIAAVQIARAAGLAVIGTGGTPEGRALVLAEGARHALDHGDPGHGDEVLRLTGGRGPDVILENLADRNLAEDLRLAAPGGRIVVVGCRGPATVEPRVAMAKDLTIAAMSLFNVPREDLAAVHREIGKGLAAGILRPAVGVEVPLAEAPRAHEAVMAPGARGKVVIRT